jgi:molybdenum-dependent DNA-binding transcriptional regulator ModE
MDLIVLEAFVSVVDHGSIVAAAARLHLTQSAVTRIIQNLEDTLGIPFVNRQTRPVKPTRAGYSQGKARIYKKQCHKFKNQHSNWAWAKKCA